MPINLASAPHSGLLRFTEQRDVHALAKLTNIAFSVERHMVDR